MDHSLSKGVSAQILVQFLGRTDYQYEEAGIKPDKIADRTYRKGYIPDKPFKKLAESMLPHEFNSGIHFMIEVFVNDVSGITQLMESVIEKICAQNIVSLIL